MIELETKILFWCEKESREETKIIRYNHEREYWSTFHPPMPKKREQVLQFRFILELIDQIFDSRVDFQFLVAMNNE
jgi:hypothetical protein